MKPLRKLNDAVLETKGRKLIFHLAKEMIRKYPIPDIDFYDYVGWGYEGLYEAAHRWTPELSSFTVYAFFWIRHRMQIGISKWCGVRRASRNGRNRISISTSRNPIQSGLDEAVHSDNIPPDQKHEHRELNYILYTLPMNLYTPLIYRYYYDLTDPEICIALSIDPKDIKFIFETAIKMLKEIYNVKECKDEDNLNSDA